MKFKQDTSAWIATLEADRRGAKETEHWGRGWGISRRLVRMRGGFSDYCWQAWFEHKLEWHEQALASIERALERYPGHEDARNLRDLIASSITMKVTSEINPATSTTTPPQVTDVGQAARYRKPEEIAALWQREKELLRIIQTGGSSVGRFIERVDRPGVLEQSPLHGRWE